MDENNNTEKLIDIATAIVAAEVQNGNRVTFIYEWSEDKQDRIVDTAVNLARKIIQKSNKSE